MTLRKAGGREFIAPGLALQLQAGRSPSGAPRRRCMRARVECPAGRRACAYSCAVEASCNARRRGKRSAQMGGTRDPIGKPSSLPLITLHHKPLPRAREFASS